MKLVSVASLFHEGLVCVIQIFDLIVHMSLKQEVEGNFLSSIYHVGQLVSCIVLQLDDDKKEKGKRKLWLSLRLSLLHKGYALDVIQEGMVCNLYSILCNCCLKCFRISNSIFRKELWYIWKPSLDTKSYVCALWVIIITVQELDVKKHCSSKYTFSSCMILKVAAAFSASSNWFIYLNLLFRMLLWSPSLRVMQVLSAYVKSIEDHGYMLHFGLPSFAGFIPKSSEAGNHSTYFFYFYYLLSCCL